MSIYAKINRVENRTAFILLRSGGKFLRRLAGVKSGQIAIP